MRLGRSLENSTLSLPLGLACGRVLWVGVGVGIGKRIAGLVGLAGRHKKAPKVGARLKGLGFGLP